VIPTDNEAAVWLDDMRANLPPGACFLRASWPGGPLVDNKIVGDGICGRTVVPNSVV